ncbi:MAG: T9SS type A sorting domain-containing protein [Cytophagaceae bacterium]|nr:T9SS type A sorting domain-containing protein [Cytophagaceae bacterium]
MTNAAKDDVWSVTASNTVDGDNVPLSISVLDIQNNLTQAQFRYYNVRWGTTITVRVDYYGDSDNDGQNDDLLFWRTETFKVQVKPPSFSPNQTGVLQLLSTQSAIDLDQYFQTPDGAEANYSINTPNSDPNPLSGDRNKMLDPSKILILDQEFTVTSEANYGSDTWCTSSSSLRVKVVDGSLTLPTFLRPVDPLPICSKANSFNLYAVSGTSTRMRIFLDYSGDGVFQPSEALQTLQTSSNYDPFTGSYLYAFAIQPRLSTKNALKVRLEKFIEVNSSIIELGNITGFIPITPQPILNVVGFPGKSAISEGDDVYICSASLSDITMQGFPSGGYFVIYTKNSTTPVSSAFKLPIPVSTAGDVKEDRFTFSPNEIFSALHLGNNRLDSSFRVVYQYPTNTVGACPDLLSFNLHFREKIPTSFEISSASPYCDQTELQLRAIDTIPGSLYRWEFWDKDDKIINQSGTSNANKLYAYQFSKPGNYKIRLLTFANPTFLSNNKKCDNDVLLSVPYGAKPIASIKVLGLEEGKLSTFVGGNNLVQNNIESNNGDDVIEWFWKFDTPEGPIPPVNAINYRRETGRVVQHPFNTVRRNTYRVTLVTRAGWGCADTAIIRVPVFPKYPITKPNEQSLNKEFEEDFENPLEANGYYHSGQYSDTSVSSWVNQIPDASGLKKLKGSSRVWGTFKNYTTSLSDAYNDTSGYYRNEKSWVETPYFDLDSINKPSISLDLLSYTDNFFDGANVQYAIINPVDTFGQEVWKNVGDPGNGVNWYNSTAIVSKPGGDFEGWSGTLDTNWRRASYALESIIGDQKYNKVTSRVRFRVAFGSNDDNLPFNYDGFAFDNLRIGTRNRYTVIEEFLNSTARDNNSVMAMQLEDTAVNQALPIRYFVGHLGQDPINDVNKADPSARALYYGIDRIERAVIDGVVYKEDVFSAWGPKEFNKRILNVSPFDIKFSVQEQNGALMVGATIKRKDPGVLNNRAFVVHRAILEDVGIESNVLRKLLPHAGGQYYSSYNWNSNLVVPPIAFRPFAAVPSQYKIVVFIQDVETKEIYQAGMVEHKNIALQSAADPSITQTGRQGSTLIPDATLYPLPAEALTTLEFSSPLQAGSLYSIRNAIGVELAAGQLKEGTLVSELPTSMLASGVYTLEIKSDEDTRVLRFIKK